jgi:hypothetical protein
MLILIKTSFHYYRTYNREKQQQKASKVVNKDSKDMV